VTNLETRKLSVKKAFKIILISLKLRKNIFERIINNLDYKLTDPWKEEKCRAQ
jgi:hypothetical protein